MKGRIPLWVALVPLAIGLAAYWLWWQREAEAFRQQVAQYVPDAETAGFPYRIEARLPASRIDRTGRGVSLALSATRATVNRQPWRTGHVVIAAENPTLAVSANGIPAARFTVRGPGALASLRRPDGVLERLSIHFDRAEVTLPFAGSFAATAFEVHLRETPTAAKRPAPTGPVQAEARITGTLARGGASFGIDLPIFATDDTPIASVAGWRDGGTIEIKGGELLTPNGAPVAGFDATLAVLPGGEVAVSGTIDTDCPVTVRSFLEGKAATTEHRARRTQRLPFTGQGSAIAVGAPEGPSGGPVRSQEPSCPVLHR